MADSELQDLDVRHGVLVRGKWQWTTSEETGRWTRPQQGYKPQRVFIPTNPTDPYNDGFSVTRSRLKIRGSGQALVIRYESEEGKDFQLLGWSIPFDVSTED